MLIKNINNKNKLPNYITDTLIENKINLINPVVNILNYVTLLTGQPLHAYNYDNIEGNFFLKILLKPEKILFLNNSNINLKSNTHVITDEKKVISLPGVI